MKLNEAKETIFRSILMILLSSVVLYAFSLNIVNAQTEQPINKQVEQALLAEDWEKAAKLLESVTPETPNPVVRLIKGHAALALNRNNESLCLFLSIASENDLKEWEKWTQEFANNNPKSPVAYYFKGDALARYEKWDEALTAFNKALVLNPKHAIVLNARGVVYAAKGNMALARNDFDNAISVNQAFADAYSNHGARFIQMKDGAEGAIKRFDEALKYSSNFALAIHGRGCVEFILDKDESKTNLSKSLEYGSCAYMLLAENNLSIDAFMNGMEKKQMLAALRGENLGTTMGKGYENTTQLKWNKYVNNQTQRNYNDFHGSFSQMDKVQQTKFAESIMKPSLDNKQSLVPTFEKNLGKVDAWNNGKGARTTTGIVAGAAGAAGGLVGGAVGGPVGGKVGGLIGGAVGGGGKAVFDNWTTKNGGGASHLKELNLTNSMNSVRNNFGGVNTSFAQSIQDYGDWPFEAIYGLLYQVKSNKISSPFEEKENEKIK